MVGRHRASSARLRRVRWLAAGAALVAAAVTALALTPSARAASDPTPNYHAGSDHATFTATGVLDSNCLVSIGGTEVWIKPGDSIDFDSALAGINLASIPNLGKVVGLNVSATIDGTRTRFTVPAGGSKTITSASLPAGDRALYWHLDSITILPIVSKILGTLGSATTVTLSPANLNSGASLNWDGVIHVTDSAPTCRLAVGTPETTISLGPVTVSVPPVSVSVPLPSLPNVTKPPLPGTGSPSPAPGSHGSSTPGVNYTPPGLTIPDEVVPKGYGAGGGGGSGSGSGGGGFGNAQPGSGGQGVGVAEAPGSHNSYVNEATPAAAKVKQNSADVATSPTPSAQMPVLLAIIAVIALSLVTAAYARMYLLRKPN